MKAVFFGSIGTLVETSELQRRSFNLAFEKAGLDWYWNTATYCKLIAEPGGKKRIANYGENKLSVSQVAEIHALKEKSFSELLPDRLYLRPTVRDVILAVREKNIKIGFITTTSEKNINLIKDCVKTDIDIDSFDLITRAIDVENPKPHPDIYEYAVKKLNLTKEKVLAIEDTAVNRNCAVSAGIKCILFPGEYAEVPPENRYHVLTYNLMNMLKSEIDSL